MDERAFLFRATELGAETMRAGRGGPFGAVIVEAGVVIGEGANRVIETHDPTAHAEVLAIRAACAKRGTFSLPGATIFASSEPCPMCLAAIYWARIGAIVFSSGREDAARAGFDDAVFYEELLRQPLERRVPMRQLQLPESPRLFDEWLKKPDRTPY
jgi:tRNA(Arg) A34 adenosine deaminase TadA